MFQKRMQFLLAALLLIGLGFVLGSSLSPIGAVDTVELLTDTERIFASIYETVSPSVVSIAVQSTGRNNQTQASGGSGFIIDQQGHITTNFHVVDSAERIEINMFDGTIVEATVVATDADADLAVIHVDLPPEKLTPIVFSDSDSLVVGQAVLAIGNPFFNDWTLTSGIISALNRTIIGLNNYSIGGVIQTDAAINPGNSGGPLLNLRGELVGVNTQIDSNLRQNAGVGFAIPSNLVRRVVTDLINNGSVNYSYIGINSRPIDLDLITQYNLPNNLQGVAVNQVLPNSPAGQAGIQARNNASLDVITAINGVPVRDFDEMVGFLSIHTSPGQQVTVSIYRGGQQFDFTVTLGTRP